MFNSSIWYCVLGFTALLLSVYGRSVTHRKERDQATLDKEVLLEDEDYDDDDVLNLTPEEQKERLKNLVEKKIDANHDGFVDLKELQSWSLKAFDNFELNDVKEEFPLVDADKDGFVTWDEFVQDMYSEDFSVEKSDDKHIVDQFKREKKIFAAADLNRDDHLDQGEYMMFRIPRQHSVTKKVIVDDVLERLDANGDGMISVEEYLKDNEHDEEDRESETERFQDDLDLNEDGMLTDDEIVLWVEPDNKSDADDEADHLMNESDANKDHKLSAAEIIDNHDIWVQSDATEYGRQLLNHDEF